jgi:hypothetical protein
MTCTSPLPRKLAARDALSHARKNLHSESSTVLTVVAASSAWTLGGAAAWPCSPQVLVRATFAVRS